MDRKLTWTHHIDNLIGRCNQGLNLMRMVSGTTLEPIKMPGQFL